jgi:uncharacterized protein YktA (UPF0223 family)
MQYSDNPRRVFGKVTIIYSDSDISMDLSAETSGNGEISNPSQVYGGFTEPTIKACTMDGNSTMGGGYQMNDVGLVTGWWSNTHCGSDGIFSTPPWLKLNFLARPLIRWIISGDSKLNQYPVDFDMKIYRESTLVDTKSYIGNSSVTISVKYDNPFEDITSIKLTIYKWSTSNAKAKIIQFFDTVKEDYEGADLKEFEILEELCKDGEVGFGINSDTASFTIYNKERKFDRGYLKSLVLLNRKVIPYIGIDNGSGGVEYTKFGTFYSDDWNVPQGDVWVKLKCVDKLYNLQKITYTGYPYTAMANLYDIAEDILLKSGLTAEQFSIDEALQNDIVYGGFMKKGSAWDCLQELCYAGMCNAYISRSDILTLQKEVVNPTNIIIAANRITAFEKHTRKTDFCNYVEVNYTEAEATNTLITAYEGIITIAAGETKTLTVDYSGYVSDASISFLPSVGIELLSFDSGVNAGKFVLKNNNANAVSTTVTIKGYSLTTATQTVTIMDEESIEKWGKQEYIYASSDLIQSYERAKEIGELILSRLTAANGNLKITWRGDPALGLQDSFVIKDRYGDESVCLNEYNRFKFDGGLSQDTRGRLINGNME